MDPLQQLTTSALSLLHTTTSHPSPFPPAPLPSPSSLLATARQLNQQLHDQLQQAHINATATRKAAIAVAHSRGESEGEQHERESRLNQRIEQLRREVEEVRGKTAVRHGILNALNHSYAINSHLSRPTISTSSAQTQRDAETTALLKKRDTLALQLLNLQSQTHLATQERLGRRRRLLELNRLSSSLTASLRANTAEPERRALEGMSGSERKAWDRIQAETKRQLAGHAIIRNVFQLVVVESGVEWYDGAALPTFLNTITASASSNPTEVARMADQEEEEEDDPEAPMDTKRLLRLMLLAGDLGGGR